MKFIYIFFSIPLIYAGLSPDQKILSDNFEKTKEQRYRYINLLQEAKFFIINGNTKRARRTLKKVVHPNSEILPLKLKLLAYINYMERKYQESYEYFSLDRFYEGINFYRTCSNRILLEYLLNITNKKVKNSYFCLDTIKKYTRNGPIWPYGLLSIQSEDIDLLKGNDIINYIEDTLSVDNSTILTWLKLALVLQKEKVILPHVKILPESAFSSHRIREVVAFIFYRLNNKSQALKFLKNIETPNANNIRGTIELEKKEYELAYNYFQLALKKAPHSVNAIERSIPLTFFLNKWDVGISLLQKIVENRKNKKQKLLLLSAFSINAKKFLLAKKNLLRLERDFSGESPVEVNSMLYYVYLQEGNKEKIEYYSRKACEQGDSIGCWIYLQNDLWPHLGHTLKREDSMHNFNSLTFESLKKEVTLDPIQEEIYINQRDIEEFDEDNFEIAF